MWISSKHRPSLLFPDQKENTHNWIHLEGAIAKGGSFWDQEFQVPKWRVSSTWNNAILVLGFPLHKPYIQPKKVSTSSCTASCNSVGWHLPKSLPAQTRVREQYCNWCSHTVCAIRRKLRNFLRSVKLAPPTAPLGRRPCVPLPVLWYPHHAPQSRIWSRFDWSFQWYRLQVYFIRMLLHQWQRSIFNQAARRRQFHCRARRMNDMQQFQQPLILCTSCTWAAFKW